MDSFYETSVWPQAKNFVARPSVKTLIEHSCPNWTQEPAPLDATIISAHEKGEKQIAEAKGQLENAFSEFSKVEKQLMEAEDSFKKNKWSKVDDKKALIDRLKKELVDAKGKHTVFSERLDVLEKRYAPINSLILDQEKLMEIYKRIMKTRDEYYGLSASA